MIRKTLILILVSVCLYSCCSDKNSEPIRLDINGEAYYEIVIIDSCEYIFGTDTQAYNGGYFLTHKGNCKNPIHKTK